MSVEHTHPWYEFSFVWSKLPNSSNTIIKKILKLDDLCLFYVSNVFKRTNIHTLTLEQNSSFKGSLFLFQGFWSHTHIIYIIVWPKRSNSGHAFRTKYLINVSVTLRSFFFGSVSMTFKGKVKFKERSTNVNSSSLKRKYTKNY